MSAAVENGPQFAPVETVKAALTADTLPGTRLVVDWFAALSAGRFDDAWGLMVPDGPYWLLRQRVTLTNAEFGKVLSGMVGPTFAAPITWKLGAITEQDDRVAVVAESFAPLVKGGTYQNMYHFLFRIQNGRIFAGYEFADTYRSAQTFAPPGEK